MMREMSPRTAISWGSAFSVSAVERVAVASSRVASAGNFILGMGP